VDDDAPDEEVRMERMSGQDATFLYTETSRTPFEIGTCLIIDTSDQPGGAEQVLRLRRQLLSRLHLAPRMRQRVQRLPFDVHHPVWVDDHRFDIDYHVRHSRLPSPGTRDQLTELLDRLLSTPLDHSRPLWEMYLVEGLEGGRSALFIKTHHAAFDGLSGFQLLTTLVDLEPDPPATEEPPPWRPHSRPSRLRLLVGAGMDVVRNPLGVPRGVARFGVDLASTLLTSRTPNEVLGASMAPPSPFNRRLSPRRSVRFFELDLEDVLKVRTVEGVKLNDVALCMVGGGVRRYLERRGIPTEPSLITYLPVTQRTGNEGAGNKTTVVSARIGTDEPHPVVRLHRVADQTRQAKARAEANNPPLILDIAAVTGPAAGAMLERLAVSAGLTQKLRLAGNLVVSNVASIPVKCWVLGAPIEEVYPIGPISDGVALNFTLISYDGRLGFSMLTDPSVIRDPEQLVADCLAEWESLREHVLR
jgi:diacylglycerol O-acyltransferase